MITEAAEFHHLQLSKHCRVCGKCCPGGKTTYSVAMNISDLLTAFGIASQSDDAESHPQKFYQSCYCSMKPALLAHKEKRDKSSTVVFAWSKHGDDCMVKRV